ncbi:hypothetical protein [Ruegeria atlantica]|uniref:hypothetical protein n=1 Tax=Ruegeria atlantica TaxID=81569 RepID=UPI0014807438|nr:hypothetical protein [Ruegeria atlantica]
MKDHLNSRLIKAVAGALIIGLMVYIWARVQPGTDLLEPASPSELPGRGGL